MKSKVIEKKYRCPLCGFEINSSEINSCNVCPFKKKCKFLLCPRCFYEFPKL
ncbi:MAG: hypothetical protein H3Z51_07295 [archaeon]|nr:hypothetical protein [archaeon]